MMDNKSSFKPATGSVQEKNGKWHACINYTDVETGKRKMRWKTLGKIDPRGRNGISKSKASEMLKSLLAEQDAETEEALDSQKRFEGLSPAEIQKAKLAEKDFYQAVVDYLHTDKKKLKPKTLQGYLTLANCHLKEYFQGKYRLKDVDVKAVDDFYDYLESLDLKTTTIKRYKALLQRTLSRAVKHRIIKESPMSLTRELKEEEFEIDPLTIEESDLLLKKIAESYDACNIVVQLALFYGIRRSEILGLRYSAIDFENKTITINYSVVEIKNEKDIDYRRCKNAVAVHTMKSGQKLVVQNLPKSKSSKRVLPLFDYVADLLKEQKKLAETNQIIFGRQYDKRFLDFVCVQADGELLMPSYVSAHFTRMLKKFGIRKVRFHDLRHTTAKFLITRSNVPLPLVKQWLGHSDIGITVKFYSHLNAEDAKETGKKIEKYGWFNDENRPKISEEVEKRQNIINKLSQ